MRLSIALLVTMLSLGTRQATAADANLSRLAWLEGTWEGVSNGIATEETH